ncbi:hypothetical protein ACWDBP_23920 [Streptomyces sp. NPDC001233]
MRKAAAPSSPAAGWTWPRSTTSTFASLSAALTAALTPETRARARAAAGTIRTDGATVAAHLLLDTVRHN